MRLRWYSESVAVLTFFSALTTANHGYCQDRKRLNSASSNSSIAARISTSSSDSQVPSGPAPSPVATIPATDAKQELLDLENHWLQVEDDPKALESILAPDFLHIVPVGIITRDEQLNYMRNHPASHSNARKHFENMHIRVYGNVGIVNGIVVSEESGTTKKTLFTDVFALRDGKWAAVNAQELPEAVRRPGQ